MSNEPFSENSRRRAEQPCGCAQMAATDAAGSEVPIVCDLSVFTAAERADHFARSQRLFAAAEGVREDADGYSFTFADIPAIDTEVAVWVENERRCCPFFRFDVRPAAGARLILSVSGPGAAKEILRAAIEERRQAVPVVTRSD